MNEHEQVNAQSMAATANATKATLKLSVSATKITARLLAKMMKAFLKTARGGQQSVKSLSKQGASLESVEVSGDNIGSFKSVARKFDIDFALQRDSSQTPPNWVVFFKAKDSAKLEAAFREFSKSVLRQKDKPSMLADLDKFKEIAKTTESPVKNRDRGER